ncbi:MAG: TonB-dependent receptor domain-containing protein [bacterium]
MIPRTNRILGKDALVLRHINRHCLALLCLFYIAGAGTLFSQAMLKGTISGTVIDAKTGESLPGVNIIIKDTVMGTSTNLDGEFRLSGIRAGTYTVVASMIGFKKQTFQVKITPGVPVMLQFKLEESFVEMSPVVVTASRKSKSLSETPNSVSVISALDIRKRNSVDIRDALKYAPGVSFVGDRVNIRGTTGYSRGAGSRVLLLTDGVPTMPGDSGDIKWDVVPYMVVEKVEVVKGAASALYGSSAIGGVLNILTKEPASKSELSVRLSGGFYDHPVFSEWDWTDKVLYTNQQDVYYSNSAGNLGYILSVGRRESRGYKENTQFLKWNVFGKTKYTFNSNNHVTFTGSYASDDHGEVILSQKYLGRLEQPFRVPEGDSENTILSTKLYLNSTYSQLIHQNFTHKFRASYFRNRFDNDFSDNQDFSKAQRFRGEYQADVQASIHHALTIGLEGNFDKVQGSFFGNHEAFILASYLQDEIKISDRFSINTGIRVDFSKIIDSRTEYQVSPKFGLIYNFGRSASLKGSVGKGFRAPSIAELFTNSTTSGFQVVPNPNLKAEDSWSAEVGLSTSLWNHVLFNVAVYQERYFDFINPGFEFIDLKPVIKFNNVQDARIRGIETNVTSGWFRNRLNTVVSYVYVDPRDLQTDKLLTYRPQHILTTSVTVKLGFFNFGGDFRFASKLKKEQLEVFPNDERVATKVCDVHAGLSTSTFTLMLNVENLLQYNYTQIERNIEPIRQFTLTFQRDF